MTFLLAFLLLFQTNTLSGPLTMAASTEKKIRGVKHLVWNPAWVPPDAKWAKGKKPTQPGDPKNPMRAVKIFFQEPDYYIHGTNSEESIGYAASHGCIRMSESDAVELARYLMEHTGMKHPDDWYSNVVAAGKPTDVVLPAGVPMVIGR